MLSSAGTFLKVIIWTTISIFLITIFLIVYDYFRRLSREKYYQKLDKDREKFYKIFSNFFKLENFSEEAISDLKSELVISSSTERQALLEILIKFSQRTPNLIYSLAKELGYIEEYEKN